MHILTSDQATGLTKVRKFFHLSQRFIDQSILIMSQTDRIV